MIWCVEHQCGNFPNNDTKGWASVPGQSGKCLFAEEFGGSNPCRMVEALLIVKENFPELWKRVYWQCVTTDSGGMIPPLACTPETAHVSSQCGWILSPVTFGDLDALASAGGDRQ